jgi:hypothetical protein
MKSTVSSVTITRPVRKERKSAFHVPSEGVPPAMSSLKGISRSKVGASITESILQEGSPVRSAISVWFREMAMSLKESV